MKENKTLKYLLITYVILASILVSISLIIYFNIDNSDNKINKPEEKIIKVNNKEVIYKNDEKIEKQLEENNKEIRKLKEEISDLTYLIRNKK